MLIHMWSGPRSMSTATMYSFSRRQDTTVIDEPLYAPWLHRNVDVFRPYREELLSLAECNSTAAMEALFGLVGQRPESNVVFAKHIAKQLVGDNIDMKYFRDGYKGVKVRHIFLIRDPLEMILSWNDKSTVHQEKCTLESLSLTLMVKLFSDLEEEANRPIVVESNLLKSHPREVLMEVSKRLGLPFFEDQLFWPAGPKPEIDGMWGKHWYDQVHMSTGFGVNSHSKKGGRKYDALSSEQLELYRRALPFFDFLKRFSVGIDPMNPNSTAISFDSSRQSSSLLADARNANLLAFVGSTLYPRELAKVSVFDSAVQGGDAVWEGLRVYRGKVFKLNEHIARLMDSAKAMMFENIPSEDFIIGAISKTLQINGMLDNAHIRLTLTRGVKTTSSMNPKFNTSGCTLIVLPEFKTVGDPTTYNNSTGITLITASTRRNGPQFVDSKIHHCNLINNILAKIQANNSNAADALMLDGDGFVSETNATNIFMLKNGILFTPSADSCLPGITRQCIIDLVKNELDKVVVEKRISLTEFYTADECFTTGTMGELSPVIRIDGRIIGNGETGPWTKQISDCYQVLTKTTGVPIDIMGCL